MQLAKLLPTFLLLAAMSVTHVETGNVPRAPGETGQDDTDLQVEMLNRRFVNALYGRVERALLDERKQYDDQLTGIHVREEELKKKLAETQEKRRLTEQKLDFKKSEHKELSDKLRKATNDYEKAEIVERLAAVSRERDEVEAIVAKLKSEEKAIKETLDFRTGWSFASKGALIKKRDRINEEWLKLAYKKTDWEDGYSPKQFSALKNSLMKTADAAALACNVLVTSENDAGETTGASIRYQTPDQRLFGATPKTAKCSTRCLVQGLKPEQYFVWTERYDKPTSNQNRLFSITLENDGITLKEYPNK